jgi:hypothetical protein
MIITTQGSIKPKTNNIFFGDFPSFLRIVQENVGGSKPRRPHTSTSGGIIMEKLNTQANTNIRQMYRGV